MKLLDTRGYIFDVYNLENGRVLKKEKSIVKQYALHLPHGNSPAYVEEHKKRGMFLAKTLSHLEIIGNPEIVDDTSYTQDKAVPIKAYFKGHSFEENTKIIDGYSALMYECWRHGFSDIILNFDRNCGVMDDGRVILFDFNEITFDKAMVADRISIKRWLKAAAYKDLPEGPLKEYYADAMEKAMTLENLDLYWKDNEQLLGKA